MIARLRLHNYDLVCRQAVELVTDYLEGRMTRRERARLTKHLRACDGCDEYLRQVEATVHLLGRVGPEDLDPATRDGLLELYRTFRLGD